MIMIKWVQSIKYFFINKHKRLFPLLCTNTLLAFEIMSFKSIPFRRNIFCRQNDQAFLVFNQGVLYPATNTTDLYKVSSLIKIAIMPSRA